LFDFCLFVDGDEKEEGFVENFVCCLGSFWK